jgi:hypothetical protein
VNDCANAFIQLLEHTIEPITREGLDSSMSPKLFRLQKRLHALPESDWKSTKIPFCIYEKSKFISCKYVIKFYNYTHDV